MNIIDECEQENVKNDCIASFSCINGTHDQV